MESNLDILESYPSVWSCKFTTTKILVSSFLNFKFIDHLVTWKRFMSIIFASWFVSEILCFDKSGFLATSWLCFVFQTRAILIVEMSNFCPILENENDWRFYPFLWYSSIRCLVFTLPIGPLLMHRDETQLVSKYIDSFQRWELNLLARVSFK